jgi:type IV secretion system protein VirD4
MILNQIGRRLTEGLETAQDRQELLLMLDELPALGRLDFFEQSVAFMAGYRIRCFLIAQSLNQIVKAYGENNSILDNCHVRVSFATNDERTARRISDSLGTATEMRAMKNYAGHRLSPWLGHLMVSRQETARPLLTPGEVMQLPADQAVVQVSGLAPIRAGKIRYYADRRLAERVEPPPRELSPISAGATNVWTEIVDAASGKAASGAGADEGGLKLEPELPGLNAELPPTAGDEAPWSDVDEGGDETQQADQARRFRSAARQSALDPDDGIPL